MADDASDGESDDDEDYERLDAAVLEWEQRDKCCDGNVMSLRGSVPLARIQPLTIYGKYWQIMRNFLVFLLREHLLF